MQNRRIFIAFTLTAFCGLQCSEAQETKTVNQRSLQTSQEASQDKTDLTYDRDDLSSDAREYQADDGDQTVDVPSMVGGSFLKCGFVNIEGQDISLGCRLNDQEGNAVDSSQVKVEIEITSGGNPIPNRIESSAPGSEWEWIISFNFQDLRGEIHIKAKVTLKDETLEFNETIPMKDFKKLLIKILDKVGPLHEEDD